MKFNLYAEHPDYCCRADAYGKGRFEYLDTVEANSEIQALEAGRRNANLSQTHTHEGHRLVAVLVEDDVEGRRKG